MATDDEAAPKLNPVPVPVASEPAAEAPAPLPLHAERVERASSDNMERASSDKMERASSDKMERASSDKVERPSSDKVERPSSVKVERPSSVKIERLSTDKDERPANDRSERPANDRSERPANDRSERPSNEKINERLTERIRQGTQPPELREDKLETTIRQRLEHLVPELVKKTFAAGMGAVFSTEEGIRKIAREVSLPDVVGYVASSADGAKDKVFEIVARETRDFLANLNLTEEIAKLLTTLSFEIKTEIRFIPNSERITGAEPDVKASVRLKRNDRAITDDDQRDSRSRLRFWRREGEDEGGDDDGGGHDK